MRRNPLVTALLIVALVVLFGLSFALAPRPTDPDTEAFGGTDAAVTETIQAENPGYEPWFTPVFEPGSGEIESGLFALQAAVGAGVLGFALGNLRGRHVVRRESS